MNDACIFFLASLPKDVFETLKRVFDQYSKGNLKVQQVKKGSQGMKLDLKVTKQCAETSFTQKFPANPTHNILFTYHAITTIRFPYV